MSVFRLGPIGALREVPPIVQRGSSVARERAGGSWTTMSGRLVVQRAPRANRTWSLDLGQWRDPADLAYLSALASGAIPGPHYLYTDAAAQANLLPADVAAPGAMGVSGLKGASGAALATGTILAPVQGALVSVAAVTGLAAAGDWSQTVPLPPGSYRLACWASATGNVLAWRSVNAAGAQVSTGTLSAVSSAGAFRATGAVTVSGAAVGVQVRVPAAAGRRVGAVRLIAGTTLPDVWLPGHGVPQVIVDDPAETLQLVTADRVAADYSITLREVG